MSTDIMETCIQTFMGKGIGNIHITLLLLRILMFAVSANLTMAMVNITTSIGLAMRTWITKEKMLLQRRDMASMNTTLTFV
jgi:hypothetical protein